METDIKDFFEMHSFNLRDAIVSLQILCSMMPLNSGYSMIDINNDERMGLEEVIYILQRVSELR